ncbi:MAG: MATE family efflux transporter [Pseudomonadota bacterium]
MAHDTFQSTEIMQTERPQTLTRHLSRTVELALPIAAARTLIVIVFIVDTMMTAWAGADQLAYLALGVAPQLTLMLVAIGALQAVPVLTSQAIGAGRPERAGDILRTGLVIALALGVIFLIAAYGSEHFYIAVGQEPLLAREAALVNQAFAWGMIGLLLFVAVNAFLEAIDHPRVGMVILVGLNVLNVPLNGVMALGWGVDGEGSGAMGAVIASSLLRWLSFVIAFYVVFRISRLNEDRYRVIADAGVWIQSVRQAVSARNRRMLRIGLPMGLAQGVESAAFAAIVFLAGMIGKTALAAHQITMNTVTLVFMVAVGIASATTIRVGNAYGRASIPDVVRGGWTGIGLSTIVPFFVTIALLTAPTIVAGLYTTDPATVVATVATFKVAAFVLVLDAVMAAILGALRGLGDVWVPLCLQISAFWILGVPTAWICGLHFNLGPPGLMIGIAVGVAVSVTALGFRWQTVSRRSIDPTRIVS